jgi:predicted Zn-ribbon and HTH transcriptional regulator
MNKFFNFFLIFNITNKIIEIYINMDDLDTWETRRQKLIRLLTVQKETIDLRFILRELEYPNKNSLLKDVNSIVKTLKNKGITLIITPPSCISCGYLFKQQSKEFKIPSKCPKCKQQRIEWPLIKAK